MVSYDKNYPIKKFGRTISNPGKRGISNEIIQSDPKRAVGFEPESPRGSMAGGDGPTGRLTVDRDATKIDVRLNSSEKTSAIDTVST